MSLTVLAVDDSVTMRNMLEAALSDAGFEVHLAEDGVDGIETLSDLSPDVIITDINMPRLDGFGFVDAVRSTDRLRGIPILVLTTECDPALKQRARDAGATGWMVKPFDETKLISIIRRVAA